MSGQINGKNDKNFFFFKTKTCTNRTLVVFFGRMSGGGSENGGWVKVEKFTFERGGCGEENKRKKRRANDSLIKI